MFRESQLMELTRLFQHIGKMMIKTLSCAMLLTWVAFHLPGDAVHANDGSQSTNSALNSAVSDSAIPKGWSNAGYAKYRELSLEELRELCKAGELKAVAEFSERLYSGNGANKDTPKAYQCFRFGAVRGDAQCQFGLARCYATGAGVEKNAVEAVQWYRKAAKQGNALSQLALAKCYQLGDGVEPDVRQAFQWIEKSAIQGLAEAQEFIGTALFNGTGVDIDKKRAVQWWRLAAEKGNIHAMNQLGECYEKGHGIDKDLERAIELYREAAKKGFAVAQKNLGRCYSRGIGVKFNRKRAEGWFTRAADQGDGEAKKNLQALAAQPDPRPQSDPNDPFVYRGWPGGLKLPTQSSYQRPSVDRSWQAAEAQARRDAERATRAYRNSMSGTLGAMGITP